MKTARPTPRKLPIQCASRRVGDCEHAFVDGVRVCLPWNPGGSWYWALEGDLIPMRPFRPEPDAAGLHADRGCPRTKSMNPLRRKADTEALHPN